MRQHRRSAASEQIRPRCARLLAKPKYSSPPDEVCCWQGRRGGAPSGRCCWQGRCSGTAGRECHGEEDGGTVAQSHREYAVGRSSLHCRECGSIGKQLRVDAETPVEKRRFRNADAATPPWNATAQKQCAAMGFVCPTLRKKLSKRASELAS